MVQETMIANWRRRCAALAKIGSVYVEVVVPVFVRVFVLVRVVVVVVEELVIVVQASDIVPT